MAMIELVKKEAAGFFAGFPELERAAAGVGPAWLQRMRTTARLHFMETGFPTVREEEWKYTNVAPVSEILFRPGDYDPKTRSGLDPDALPFGGVQGHRLVFVNGQFAENLSSIGRLPAGVRICSLAELLKKDPDAAQSYLGRYAASTQSAFGALNMACMNGGAFVYVAAGKIVEEPIHLLFLSTGADSAVATFPRNLIIGCSNSQASIVESYVGLRDGVGLTAPVTEVLLGYSSVMEHSRLCHEGNGTFHVATVQYQQERGSSLTSHSIALGGGLVRNNLNAVMDGEGSDATFNGLYLIRGGQHVDNHTRLEHAAPHCSSREVYKGILDGNSRGVFHGRIVVHRGAQKTDSKQTNNNILLSDEALVNTNPELEIYADDVKCTHGATIGQLDKDAVFYLRSRGIGERAARALLIYAFASQIVRRVKVEGLRAELDRYLLGWLHGDETVREAVSL